MKKTTISLAVAAIVVAVLGWGAAGVLAQWGWGWGGSHASTAAEGAAYGMADVVRAQGDYNLSTSAAAINMTQAQRNDIENRQKWTETYFEMRRVNKAYHDSLKKAPSPDAMARYAAAGKPKRLSANDFDAVSGAIRWPELLQGDKYASQRGQLDALFAERASKGAATKGQRDQVRSLTGAIIDGLQQDIDSLPPPGIRGGQAVPQQPRLRGDAPYGLNGPTNRGGRFRKRPLAVWHCLTKGGNMDEFPVSLRSTRRGLLGAAATGLVVYGAGSPASAAAPAVEEGTVGDRLWIFTCAANSDFPIMQRRSVVTPVEGAFLLGVPNLIAVQSSETESRYGRLEPPFAQYTVAMRPLKRVVWSVVGSGGFHSPKETEEVLELARSTPNFAGIMLDDFFTGQKDGKRAQLTVSELAEVRRRLKQINGKFDILVTLYVGHLDLPLRDYLDLIDVITLWTGSSEQLVHLEANLKKVETLAPKMRKMLGCYVVDYGKKQGTPVPLMKLQCETGLRWLRERRIEGIVFLGNTTMDLGFESVEWTREWIRQVRGTRL